MSLADALLGRGITPATKGSLHLICTPIGNLGDLTLRALRTLETLDLLYCEDTRTTGVLLKAAGLSVRTRSLTEHNEAERIASVLAGLAAGDAVGLVSDAGAPLLSDPGERLTRAVVDAGHPVVPIPGASAPVAALIGSGLAPVPHAFHGFAPRKAGALRDLLEAYREPAITSIFFESPNRIDRLLERFAEHCDPVREVVVARELTKRFETFHRGTVGVPPRGPWKGECVVLLGPAPRREADPDELRAQVVAQALGGASAKDICAALAGRAPRRELYAMALEALKSDGSSRSR
jgi:16S rRNA (cytidine1402-2'-O)-methyltransferase